MNLNTALLSGYLMVRMSVSILTRSGRDFLQITVWDRSKERLEWARGILQDILPPSIHNKPVKIVWVQGRKQGSIHVTGRRAIALLQIINPYIKNTPLKEQIEHSVERSRIVRAG